MFTYFVMIGLYIITFDHDTIKFHENAIRPITTFNWFVMSYAYKSNAESKLIVVGFNFAVQRGFVEAHADDGLLEIFGLKQGWHASFVMVELISAKHIAQVQQHRILQAMLSHIISNMQKAF